MRRLHGARSAAACHEKPRTAQRYGNPSNGRVGRRASRFVMTAHDSGDSPMVFQKSDRRLSDGIVVQRFEDAGKRIARRGPPVLDVIGEAFEIDGTRERAVVASVEAAHQILGGIERGADRAEREFGKHGNAQHSRKWAKMDRDFWVNVPRSTSFLSARADVGGMESAWANEKTLPCRGSLPGILGTPTQWGQSFEGVSIISPSKVPHPNNLRAAAGSQTFSSREPLPCPVSLLKVKP